MGLFDMLKTVASESPGRVMKLQLDMATEKIKSFDRLTAKIIIANYMEKQEMLSLQHSNSPSEIAIRAGNKLKKTSPIEGYPLLLAGMWLESRHQTGPDARYVFSFLDSLSSSEK